ncbi:MAG: DUF721 domain-containing protein [Nitrospirae bacterium]|nr:DUF721 domain-containing protein [Nitrospirota bacterium]
MQRAGSVIHSIIKDLGMEDNLCLYRMKSEWHSLFQPPVCLHMSPSSLSEAHLTINVDSPQWLQEISFYKEDIIRKLHGFGVKDIRLRVGRVRIEKCKGVR